MRPLDAGMKWWLRCTARFNFLERGAPSGARRPQVEGTGAGWKNESHQFGQKRAISVGKRCKSKRPKGQNDCTKGNY